MLRKGTGSPSPTTASTSSVRPTTGVDSLFVGLSLGTKPTTTAARAAYPGNISSSSRGAVVGVKVPSVDYVKKAFTDVKWTSFGFWYAGLRWISFLAHLSMAIALWAFWYRISGGSAPQRLASPGYFTTDLYSFAQSGMTDKPPTMGPSPTSSSALEKAQPIMIENMGIANSSGFTNGMVCSNKYDTAFNHRNDMWRYALIALFLPLPPSCC